VLQRLGARGWGIPFDMKTDCRIGRTSKLFVGMAVATTMGISMSTCWSAGAGASAVSTKQQLRQQNRESAVKASVSAVNQTSNGYSVTINSVTYPKNSISSTSANEGVVTIAPLVNGKPGDVAGFVDVRHGTTKAVRLPLQVQLNSGTYRLGLYPGTKLPSNGQRPLAGTDATVTVS